MRIRLGELRSVIREVLEVVVLTEGGLAPAEMVKRLRGGRSRWSVFLDKMNSGSPFRLTNGDDVVIPIEGNAELVAALEAGNEIAYAMAFKAGVLTSDPDVVLDNPKLLAKTKEFGGIGAGGGLRAETRQAGEISAAITAAVEENGGPIDIWIGTGGSNAQGVARGVVGINQVKSRKKADVELVDGEGSVVAQISLKAASSAEGMNQWGGVSAYLDDPAVAEFAADLQEWVAANGPIPSGRVVVRAIDPSSQLALTSTWGGTPPNMLDLIIASSAPIALVADQQGVYEFMADYVWYSPEPIDDPEWAPTLTARPGDRNDLGIPNTRVGVFPAGYRNVGKQIPLPPRGRSAVRSRKTPSKSRK